MKPDPETTSSFISLSTFAVSIILFLLAFSLPADVVAIKIVNYPSGLINITIITPSGYKQAVMSVGW